MRQRLVNDQLTLQAVAGSHVVMLGFSLPQALTTGLLGFAVHRTDHDEQEAYWLRGKKTFAATDPGFLPGATYSTRDHTVQGFTWSDFSAKPDHRYTYRVVALGGTPDNLQPMRECAVEVTTEPEVGQVHHVFFNRGAAASQEYANRFRTPPNENNPNDPRWAWLSRGASEAIETFIARAIDSTWGLRVAAYEFRLKRVADLLKAAVDRGVDVRVLYDACANRPDADGVVFPRDLNLATATAAGLVPPVQMNRITRSDVLDPPIGHHKFIVLTHDGVAEAVLTGSTNFSLGGVFGQSNVVHVVNDATAAGHYLTLWNDISVNPVHATLRQQLSARNAIPVAPPPERLPPAGNSDIFSPQQNLDALNWYAHLVQSATGAVMMTFAFGMPAVFKDAYRNSSAKLRYALLDKLIPSGTPKAQQPAKIAEMTAIRAMKENRFAVGSRIAVNSFDRWVKERLTGLNSHVQYIHTKFMLLNPLSDDPIVITGSANFSEDSTKANDENMLVIRGNTRVADIYLGEYMRLWNHYAFREWASKQADPADTAFKHLVPNDTWAAEYYGDTDHRRQREYFAGE